MPKADLIDGAVALHVEIEIFQIGVAPFFPLRAGQPRAPMSGTGPSPCARMAANLDHRQRDGLIQHGGENIHKGHACDGAWRPVW